MCFPYIAVWLALTACLITWFAGAQPYFREVAEETGLDFKHVSGREGHLWTLEITGSGVAVLDYDSDGRMDIYAVQGGPLRDREGVLPSDQLFRNVGNDTGLRFEDVSEKTGLDKIARSYGMGIATGDLDNDGDVDIFLANYGANQLLENRDGKFVDVTAEAGITGEEWSLSASLADLNGDGLLDIYVANYMEFPNLDAYIPCRRLSTRLSYCAPSNFEPVADKLYLNEGDGKFRDASWESGISSRTERGMGVVVADLNRDGENDVYVANDMGENFLWLNQGNAKFQNVALLNGVAVNSDGRREASMGIALADYDHDFDLDIFVTHDIKESNTLYRNLNDGSYEDRTTLTGLATPSLPNTGFGTDWLDVENDGDLDLFIANGSVSMIESQVADDIEVPLRQFNQLMVNDGAGNFSEVKAGPAFTEHRVSRGLAIGDLDNDGDLDAVISNNDDRLCLYLNESVLPDGTRGNWIGIELVDQQTHNVANVRVRRINRAGGYEDYRQAHSDGSYASARDPRILIGLGSSRASQQIEITWSDGTKHFVVNATPNQYNVFKRGVD